MPSLSNSLTRLFKDTSLVSVIAVGALMLATKEVIATTLQPFPFYLTAAIYWAVSALFETPQKKLETRLNRSYRSQVTALALTDSVNGSSADQAEIGLAGVGSHRLNQLLIRSFLPAQHARRGDGL